LYWNCLKRYEGNEAMACEDVKKKYFDDFAKTKDLYLFLGTTRVSLNCTESFCNHWNFSSKENCAGFFILTQTL